MRTQFELTGGPTSVTATGRQSLAMSVDVSGFDSLDFLLFVQQASFPQLVNQYGAAIVILTGMQNDTESGWVRLCSFPPIFTPNSSVLRSVSDGILKYIRWSVPVFGAATSLM